MPTHESFKPIHALPHSADHYNLLCGALALALIHSGAPIWQAAVAVGVGLSGPLRRPDRTKARGSRDRSEPSSTRSPTS